MPAVVPENVDKNILSAVLAVAFHTRQQNNPPPPKTSSSCVQSLPSHNFTSVMTCVVLMSSTSEISGFVLFGVLVPSTTFEFLKLCVSSVWPPPIYILFSSSLQIKLSLGAMSLTGTGCFSICMK